MRLRAYTVGILISFITVIVYYPALRCGFVNVDDHNYIINNEHIRSLDSSLVHWAFTTFLGGNWHPLTWMSLGIDHYFWDLNPLGYHLHSVILHSFNVIVVTILTFEIVRRYRSARETPMQENTADRDMATAALTAVMFALHPLRVESVVWITERKDVLYAFFYLLSVYWYVLYTAQKSPRRATLQYLAALSAFMLSLLSKAMAVSLPMVLILLDVFCLRRMDLRSTRSVLQGLKEKVPFLAFALAASILAIVGQTSGDGRVGSLTEYPVSYRMLKAVHSLWFYVSKTILPTDLSPFYPLPREITLSDPEIVLAIAMCIAIATYSIVAYRRGKEYWAGIWGYYLVTLLPVLGIVHVGHVRAADRFTYLPTLGLLMLISMGLIGIARSVKESLALNISMTRVLAAIALLLTITLSVATMQQIGIWKDSLTLANRAVAVNPQNTPIPYLYRGGAWALLGNIRNSYEDCNYALVLDPTCIECLLCRAEAREDLGDLSGAIADYTGVLTLNALNTDALNNRGLVYAKMGDPARAQADFQLRDILASRKGGVRAP